jgi:magnesium transporter
LIRFERATEPLADAFDRLLEEDAPDLNAEERRALRDLRDHLLRTTEQIEGFRELLSDILNVNLALIGINQNDQTKKISAWAAILIVATIISGIHGMNLQFMPETTFLLGYPFALSLMVLISIALYTVFKRRGWL